MEVLAGYNTARHNGLLTNRQRLLSVLDVFGEDRHAFLLGRFDMSRVKPAKAQVLADGYRIFGVFPGEIQGEPGPHVKGVVRLLVVNAAMLLEEIEDRELSRQPFDDIGVGLWRPHKLTPSVTRHIDPVVKTHSSAETGFDRPDVDKGGIQQCLAVCSAVG